MKVNGDLLVLCCYCSTDDINTNTIVKGMLLLQCTNENDNTNILKVTDPFAMLVLRQSK